MNSVKQKLADFSELVMFKHSVFSLPFIFIAMLVASYHDSGSGWFGWRLLFVRLFFSFLEEALSIVIIPPFIYEKLYIFISLFSIIFPVILYPLQILVLTPGGTVLSVLSVIKKIE